MEFDLIIFVIPIYFICLHEIIRISHYGHFRSHDTFLDSIFAVYRIALCPVRILTGLCFVGTPPPLSGGFGLGYFHAFRVRPVSTSLRIDV